MGDSDKAVIEPEVKGVRGREMLGRPEGSAFHRSLSGKGQAKTHLPHQHWDGAR